MKYIFAKQFYFTDDTRGEGYLALNDDGTFGDYYETKPVDATEILDFSAYQIAPGLVDTHIHGYYGHDVMDNSFEGMLAMAKALPACGVTSFLPTTLTASDEELQAVCQTVARAHTVAQGAKMQGIFLEGPFLSEAYKGAQNAKYMLPPSLEMLKKWQACADGFVKKIAIAPELAGAVGFTEKMKEMGITTAIAHTAATYDECQNAVQAGASVFVHTFNGMAGLHHREPGTVGAAMTISDVFVEVICDGYHVHPVAVKILMEMVGNERMVLISDCMKAGGIGEGESQLGEFVVVVKDGKVQLKDNGSLAGSVLELIRAVQNVVTWGIVSPAAAIKMASYNAAKSAGIEDVCGSIRKGAPADFIVLDDQLQLMATYIDGVQAFQRPMASSSVE